MRSRGVLAIACFLLAGLMISSEKAFAQEAAQASNDANQLFATGSQLFLSERYVEALDALRSSYRLVPSPNSGLLIARCLQRLGRLVEAAEMYGTVETEGKRRAQVDVKYTRTAEVAKEEGAAVRAQLGSVRILVRHAPIGTSLEVDGVPTQLPDDGSLFLWRAPGTTTVRVSVAGGEQRTRAISVLAGTDVVLDFELGDPQPKVSSAPASPPSVAEEARPHPSRETPPWFLPAVVGSGGLTLAGFGFFAGFGLSSRATYNNLAARCGPHACGDAERAEIARGERNQTIANVSLAVGIVGAIATTTLVVLQLSSGKGASKAALAVGPDRAMFQATFE